MIVIKNKNISEIIVSFQRNKNAIMIRNTCNSRLIVIFQQRLRIKTAMGMFTVRLTILLKGEIEMIKIIYKQIEQTYKKDNILNNNKNNSFNNL